jgi:mRNA export factor
MTARRCADSLLQDGTKVIGAGADKQAKMMDLGSGNTTTAQQVAAHDQPIRCCHFVDVPGANIPVLVTGSWDRTVKYWDLRQSTPAVSVECQERVYAMDAKEKLLVIGTADRYINVINLSEPNKFFKTLQSPLKWQTRVVSCFNDGTGFGIGSIEGRCAMQYVEEKDQK